MERNELHRKMNQMSMDQLDRRAMKNPKWTTFQATGSGGERETWAFQRVRSWDVTLKRYVTGWHLRTGDGCVRISEGTWIDFVPFVQLIAENYGLVVEVKK